MQASHKYIGVAVVAIIFEFSSCAEEVQDFQMIYYLHVLYKDLRPTYIAFFKVILRHVSPCLVQVNGATESGSMARENASTLTSTCSLHLDRKHHLGPLQQRQVHGHIILMAGCL